MITNSEIASEKVSSQKRNSIFYIGALFSFTLFFFPPCELYLNNVNEFWFGFKNIVLLILISSIAVFAIIVLIGLKIPKKCYLPYAALIFGITIAAYIQGNFLNNDYGVLDGKEIQWGSYTVRGIISIAVWILVIAGVFILISKWGRYLETIAKATCFLLIVMQTTALVFLWYNKPAKSVQDYVVTDDKLFEYSTERNIIVLCLDAFDSNRFAEILEEYPEFYSVFKDFTFYNNMSGMYPTTKASIPYMLTGIPYENKEPYDKYINKAYKETSLYNTLDSNGYEYGIYTYIGINKDIMERSNNGANDTYTVSSYAELEKMLYKASLFKYMPQQFKRFFWLYTGDFDSLKQGSSDSQSVYNNSNLSYLDLMQSDVWSTTDQKVFKFIHLRGAHGPYNMDENMQQVEKSDYSKQSVGALRMVKEYMDYLKEFDLYNNTCLIILADHGTSAFSSYVQTPLFMVKGFEKTGEKLLTDTSSLSYSELQNIYISQITGGERVENVIQGSAIDERRFLYYDWNDKWDAEYMPVMRELTINGDVNDASKIISTGKVYASEMPEIKFDEPLLFYKTKSANDYFIQGLRTPTPDCTWGYDEATVMKCHTNKRADIYVNLKYIHVRGDQQRLTVKLDNEVLYDNTLKGSGLISFIVPKELVKKVNGDLELRFEYENNIALDENVEKNRFQSTTIAYNELLFSLEPIDYPRVLYGETLSFDDKQGDANNYFIRGLSEKEEKYTWTDGTTAEMGFYTDSKEMLYLKIKYSMVCNESQTVKVNLGDVILFENTLTSAPGEINLEISADIIRKNNGNIKLEYSFPDAISPKELGRSKDARKLAIALQELRFSEKPFPVGKEAELNSRFSFTRSDPSANEYFSAGLSVPEDLFTWTDGTEAVMKFHTDEEALRVNLSYYFAHNDAQMVTITSDGTPLFEGTLSGAETDFSFIVPADIIEKNAGNVEIKFFIPNAISPKELGRSEDARVLGIALQELSFSTVE